MKTLDPLNVIDSLGPAYLRELSTFGALTDVAIADLLAGGRMTLLNKGEVLFRAGAEGSCFYVLLRGRLALYKQCEGHDVLTRHYEVGEQLGFDAMIGLQPRSGTAVASEETLVVEISNDQFYIFHVVHVLDFGLLMINLARELSRDIAKLEDVVAQSTGWCPR